MSLQILFIEGKGSRHSICNNDALSVVVDNQLLDIIPAYELDKKGLRDRDVRRAFTDALTKFKDSDEDSRTQQRTYARKSLGLEG